MKITIVNPIGYCAGVTNAINIALNARKEHPESNIYILGKLVHNESVIALLKDKNIITLEGEDKINLISSLKKNDCLIFTAHGHDPKLNEYANEKGLIIYDATCPKVKLNMDLINRSIKDKEIVYIGYKSHPETVAALSLSNKVNLYDVNDGIDYSLIKDKSPLVLNQTTLNIDMIKDIYVDIKSHFPNAIIQDEICNATRLRQDNIKSLSQDVDLIIIVGESFSSNSLRLYEIAKLNHPNIDVIMVNDINQIDINSIKNKNHIAIASGTSTPIDKIDEITRVISKL